MAGKQLLGQPWWVWAAGGAALVGGYLWIRHSQKQQATAQQAAAATPVFVGQGAGIDQAALATWLLDHQGSTGKPGGGKPHNCPKGQAWDPDSKKCIPEHRGHRGKAAAG